MSYVFRYLDDVYDNLKTGDLILFRSKRWVRYLTYFTHVGMIVDFHGKKYILDLNQKNLDNYGVNSGVKMYDLYDRIRKFNGEIYILEMHHSMMNETRKEKFFRNLNKYFKIKFDSNVYMNILKMKLGFKLNSNNRDGLYCSEFIGYILQDLEILNKNVDISMILPKTFMKLRTDDGVYIYNNIYILKNNVKN